MQQELDDLLVKLDHLWQSIFNVEKKQKELEQVSAGPYPRVPLPETLRPHSVTVL